MNAAETTTIEYVKTNGDWTERNIIVIDPPKDQIKALDVTDWEHESCRALEDLVKQYRKYKEVQIKKIFTFEDWLDHTGNESPETLEWRTFKLNGIQSEYRTNLCDDLEF
jgi:hypothetical protein